MTTGKHSGTLPIVGELRAIDEEAMYQAPASTHKTVNTAADTIELLYDALELARKILATHGLDPDQIRKALAKSRGEQVQS